MTYENFIGQRSRRMPTGWAHDIVRQSAAHILGIFFRCGGPHLDHAATRAVEVLKLSLEHSAGIRALCRALNHRRERPS